MSASQAGNEWIPLLGPPGMVGMAVAFDVRHVPLVSAPHPRSDPPRVRPGHRDGRGGSRTRARHRVAGGFGRDVGRAGRDVGRTAFALRVPAVLRSAFRLLRGSQLPRVVRGVVVRPLLEPAPVAMLRITSRTDAAGLTVVVLEGRLAGPWAEELAR